MTPSGQTLSIDPASAETEGVARFPRLAVVSGIVNALLASWLLMMLHSSFQLPPAALIFPALAYVACSALLAAAGARYYWRQAKFRSSFTQQELMLTWAAAWVWMPAIVLFLRRDFIWAPLLAALAAALPACSMKWLRTKAERTLHSDTTSQPTSQPIFAATLQPIPWDWHGLVIAICIYASCASFADGDTPLACILAPAGAFLFAQQRAAAWDGRAETLSSPRRAKTRLAWSALLAVLVTALALIPGQQGSTEFGLLSVAAKSAKAAKKPDVTEPGGLGSYQSVILWPQKPEKQLIVPPDMLNAAPLSQPQTIRFSGEYWYFESPAEEPGPNAHMAHGNPMDVSIRTLNTRPLMMHGHQKLAKPIRLSTVRAIDVTMLNRDNDPGILSISVALTDSAYVDKTGLNLGLQPLISTQPDHFAVKTVPISEKLHFVIPAQSRQRRFDGITVMILPAANRMHSGARVAIDHFDLVPR